MNPAGERRDTRRLLQQLWQRRWFRRTGYVFVCLAAVGLIAARYFGIRSYRDVTAYWMMYEECDPVWRDLALRRIYAGQSVDEATAVRPPSRVIRHGRYVELFYLGESWRPGDLVFVGVYLVGKDGRLVWATSFGCTFEHVFFDSLSDADKRDRAESLQAYLKARAARAAEAHGDQDREPGHRP